jgi:hypothetical protein
MINNDKYWIFIDGLSNKRAQSSNTKSVGEAVHGRFVSWVDVSVDEIL